MVVEVMSLTVETKLIRTSRSKTVYFLCNKQHMLTMTFELLLWYHPCSTREVYAPFHSSLWIIGLCHHWHTQTLPISSPFWLVNHWADCSTTVDLRHWTIPSCTKLSTNNTPWQLGYHHWTNDPYTCVDGARRRLSLPCLGDFCWAYSEEHCIALCTISGVLLTQCQHSIGIFQPETWGSRLTDTCLPGTCSIISNLHMQLHVQVGQKYTTVQVFDSWVATAHQVTSPQSPWKPNINTILYMKIYQQNTQLRSIAQPYY